jgi:ADP-ribose pyrophosphatase YjhB (NUDIX family)|tara:strand:+ start:2628 stop:3119 length:492 start_codon:yes stop_codon:yes gene_type:complete
MKYDKYCSNCSKKNTKGYIDGNIRYHCEHCSTIHYQNPKPTATLICPKDDSILLGRRAFNPGKGEWGLPGGFMELNETLDEAAKRELKEETNLDGRVTKILGTCSHYGSIFGDILLIGLEVQIDNWSSMIAGDDVAELELFNINKLPALAFDCHRKIVSYYLK